MAHVLAGHVLTEIQLMEMHDHVALGAAIGEFDFARKQTTDEDVEIAEKVLSGEYTYTEGPFSAVTGQPIYPFPCISDGWVGHRPMLAKSRYCTRCRRLLHRRFRRCVWVPQGLPRCPVRYSWRSAWPSRRALRLRRSSS